MNDFTRSHHIISGRDLKFPRMQIYTIEELLNGALVKMPAHALEATMRKAERKKKEKSEEQMPLL